LLRLTAGKDKPAVGGKKTADHLKQTEVFIVLMKSIIGMMGFFAV